MAVDVIARFGGGRDEIRASGNESEGDGMLLIEVADQDGRLGGLIGGDEAGCGDLDGRINGFVNGDGGDVA